MNDRATPGQSDTDLPFEPSAAAVSAWLDELPILNTVQTGEKVHKALRCLNKLEIEPATRFKLLERLRPTVCLLSNALEKQFIDASFPLSKQQHKLAKLSALFHKELAVGYKTLGTDPSFTKNDLFSPLQQATCVERALYSLAQEQLRIAQRYEACSERFWKQYCALYLLIEQLDLMATPVTDDLLQDNFETTAGAAAKQILLFSLSSPNRFSQRGIKELHTLLQHHAELAELNNQSTNEQQQKANYYFHLEACQPPLHISRLENPGSSERYLYTQALVGFLIDHFDSILKGKDGLCQISSKRMLGKIVRSLGAPERRSAVRRGQNEAACTIIPELENIIIHLMQQETSAQKPAAEKQIKPKNANELWNDIPDFGIIPMDQPEYLPSSRSASNMSRGETMANFSLSISKDQVKAEEIWNKKPTPQGKSRPVLDCNILNNSKKGFRLLRIRDEHSKIKVGEIISIQQANHQMEIDVIRWIEQDETSGLSFGVEQLSPIARVVTITSPKQPDSEVKGLFIPALPEPDSGDSLLISPSKFRTGAWIDLKKSGKPKRYQLHKLLEISPSFHQFTLFKLDNREQVPENEVD